jgi:hypothetical protein
VAEGQAIGLIEYTGQYDERGHTTGNATLAGQKNPAGETTYSREKNIKKNNQTKRQL